MTNFDLTAYLENCRARVDQALSEALPSPAPGDDPMRLWEGMRYSVLQGGKRMRPVVVIAACEAAARAAGVADRRRVGRSGPRGRTVGATLRRSAPSQRR